MSSFPKSSYNPVFFYNKYCILSRHFHNFAFIFTDGSLHNDIAAAAACCPDANLSARLPPGASIFTAEAKAILLAFEYINRSPCHQFVIFSDSKSVLVAIKNRLWSNPIILTILNTYNNLIHDGKQITLFWIPSHVGIPGNERADRLASQARNGPSIELLLPYTDFLNKITIYINSIWQFNWNSETNNKLSNIKPNIGTVTPLHIPFRRYDVIVTRLRLGHTYLTHSHLFHNNPPPICACGSLLSVKGHSMSRKSQIRRNLGTKIVYCK